MPLGDDCFPESSYSPTRANTLPTPLLSLILLHSVTFKWDDVFWHPESVSVFIKPAGTITDADFENEAKEVVLSRRDLRV